jgi:DNA polymerase-4/protein ImuB
MSKGASLTSEHAACVWIPLFALRAEERRQPQLIGKPTAVLSADDTRRLWQVSPRARHVGVKPGMTVSQAIGLCPVLTLLEADPVHYDELFSRLLLELSDVSPVVEPVELGRVYVGVDGLERLIGKPEEVLSVIDRVLRRAWGGSGEHRRRWGKRTPLRHEGSGVVWRMGWARGKFPSWVAATRAKPGMPAVVPNDQLTPFLAAQRIGALPLNPDTHRRLWQLGLRQLRDLTALPEQAVISQFGREGRFAWRLAAGTIVEPITGKETPRPIIASMDFPTPIVDQGILANTIGKLTEQALRNPRRTSWRVRCVRVRAALEHGSSWMVNAVLKDPSASREHIATPLITKLEQAPPTGGVEHLTVEFTAFVRGTKELQLFARDAAAAARTGQRREIKTRLNRSMLHHIIEVHPWSRIPERRYALIDFDP